MEIFKAILEALGGLVLFLSGVTRLASQGLITLPVGISIMLGAEIGTCADTLIATIGRSRDTIRAGIFHLLFNITTVIVGIYLADYIATLSKSLSQENVSRQIANAHLIFNLGGVAILYGSSTTFLNF